MITRHNLSLVSTILADCRQILLLAVLLTGVLQTADAANIPTNGLVAFYPLSGDASDASGNGHDGVISGTLTPAANQTGQINGASHFPGGYITVTPTPFDVTANWTISYWCAIDTGNNAVNDMVSTGNDNLGAVVTRWYGLSVGQPAWQLLAGHQYGVNDVGSGWLTARATNSPYQWNMLTWSKNGNSLEIYINSTLIGSNSMGAPVSDQGWMIIGSGDYPLNGSMSDFLIYNRSLSSNEVTQLYSAESQPPFVITNQPANATRTVGDSVTFGVGVGSVNPVTYQWFKDSASLPNATNYSLTLTNLQLTDSGNYSVTITDNHSNALTSSNAILLVSSAGPGPGLMTGLVAFYPLNGNANDASGNGHDGVLSGTMTPATNQAGVARGAIHFPGTSISVTPTPFDVTSDWTISYWCQLDAGNMGVNDMISTGNDNAGGVVSRWLGSGSGQSAGWALLAGHQYGVNGAGSGVLVAPATNSPYQWNMVTSVKSGSSIQMFLNSTLIGSSSAGATVTDRGWMTIGSGDYLFGGSLSDVFIYNRSLAPNEVAQLYTNGFIPPDPAITNDVTDIGVLAGSNATFHVGALSSNPLNYQWYWMNSNPAQFAGAFALTLSNQVFRAVVTNSGFGYGNIPNVSFIGGGGSGASGYGIVSNGMVTGIQVTNLGSGYTGIPEVVIDPPNGILTGKTNSSLTLTNVGNNNLGGYFVVVSNAKGSTTSGVGNLTVLYPPSIVLNPLSVNLKLHGSNTLSVSATGSSPLSYQWTFNSTNINGAIGTNYSITHFALTNIGNYAAVVSNPYGTVTSTVASVQMLPSLTMPFTGLIGLWGQPATLSVGAVGSGILNYQWYFNGKPIAGATSNNYILPGVQFTNAGLYSVVASSAYGSVSNNAYQLVVNPANVAFTIPPNVVIQGTVGYTYAIQSTTNLGNTNSWIMETNIVLTQPIQNWTDYNVDTSKPILPRKFYRVVAGQ